MHPACRIFDKAIACRSPNFTLIYRNGDEITVTIGINARGEETRPCRGASLDFDEAGEANRASFARDGSAILNYTRTCLLEDIVPSMTFEFLLSAFDKRLCNTEIQWERFERRAKRLLILSPEDRSDFLTTSTTTFQLLSSFHVNDVNAEYRSELSISRLSNVPASLL